LRLYRLGLLFYDDSGIKIFAAAAFIFDDDDDDFAFVTAAAWQEDSEIMMISANKYF